jgi:hypothetical protein
MSGAVTPKARSKPVSTTKVRPPRPPRFDVDDLSDMLFPDSLDCVLARLAVYLPYVQLRLVETVVQYVSDMPRLLSSVDNGSDSETVTFGSFGV